MSSTIRTAVMLAAILGLAACESSQPMTRTGEVLDHAGTVAGNAVGDAGRTTGNAIDNAGTYVKDKVNP